MSILKKIMRYFRKGGVAIGAKKELKSILDHPKINMDAAEYERIQNSLMYYRGEVNCGQANQKEANVNMARKVAAEYAKVMFNEQAEIVVGKAEDTSEDNPHKKTNEWIESVFEHNDFKRNLSKYLEPAMALGGLSVRPYVNKNSGKIEFSWAIADAFYPLESNTNKISSCAIPFRTTKSEGDKIYYYTLLEFHEWMDGEYCITNELYESEKPNALGVQVPLSTLDQYANLEESVVGEGVTRPIFSYFKTAGFNNLTPHSPLGVGVYDNSKQTLDKVSKMLDSFDKEIEKGARKIAVPESMTQGIPDSKTGQIKMTMNPDEDYYVVIPGTDPNQFQTRDLTSDIRTEAYIGAINHRLRILEMEVGLSTGTFVFDGQGIRTSNKTATEVISENSQTYQSRNQQLTELREFIRDVVLSICELGQATTVNDEPLFKGESPKREEIGVNFDDGIFLDKKSESEYYRELKGDGLIPGWMAISKIMKIPEIKAKQIYKEAQLDTVEVTTRNMNDVGFGNFEE
ncbi:phage portal protein [Enterococcus faecium]